MKTNPMYYFLLIILFLKMNAIEKHYIATLVFGASALTNFFITKNRLNSLKSPYKQMVSMYNDLLIENSNPKQYELKNDNLEGRLLLGYIIEYNNTFNKYPSPVRKVIIQAVGAGNYLTLSNYTMFSDQDLETGETEEIIEY